MSFGTMSFGAPGCAVMWFGSAVWPRRAHWLCGLGSLSMFSEAEETMR